MKQLGTGEHCSGFAGKSYHDPACSEPSLALPQPYQTPYPPMLLPVASQESFVPMGTQGYRIAIGAGRSPPPPPGGRRASAGDAPDRGPQDARQAL